MNTIRNWLKSRTAQKLGRDLLVIGIPGALIWVIGHPVELERFGLDGGETLKVTGYAASLLALYRIGRGYFRGSV